MFKPENCTTTIDLDSIRESLTPFAPTIPTRCSDQLLEYLSLYGMDRECHFSMGTLPFRGENLTCYYIQPESACDTVLILHGYLDHVGMSSRLQELLLERQYAVLMVDHPGHGFSSGARADISSFELYSDVAKEMIAIHERENLPGKLHVMGHSMGGAIILDLIRRFGQIWSGETILFAPLVRSDRWALSRFAYHTTRKLVPYTPRNFQNTSHDPSFLAFLKCEPHRINRFPMSWAGALLDWNKKIEAADLPDIPLTVIQGEEEFTVDWRHNIRFFKETFPRVQFHLLPEGRHHLWNESDSIRSQVFAIVEDTLLLRREQ